MHGKRLGSVLGVTFFVLIGILVGSSTSIRAIRRTLQNGHDATAFITGASLQHRSPLTFDGMRPRYLDETYSLDLTWKGEDGIQRSRQKVPVTESFMKTIETPDHRVRLVPVPIKVIDEDGAVPVVTPDAPARLHSLATLNSLVTYGPLGSGLLFAIVFGLAILGNRSEKFTRPT